MSEVTQKLKYMLVQAQMFAADAPLEALARAELAVREAKAALHAGHGIDRDQLTSLLAIAQSRVELYGARLSKWTAGVQERADLFEENEMQRLEQPLPGTGKAG
jgi:hypothetical protein